MEPIPVNNKRSTPQEFVDLLLTEGAKVSCDDASQDFCDHDGLPPFYDEKLFKRGQEFFYQHVVSFFFSKCLGLIAVLSIPSILKMLLFTKMSSSVVTSYRRYVATILHMMLWYKSDFKPGSKLWRSIAEVRDRHNSASKRSCAAGLQRITQKDMVLTQFGFMGISLCRSKMLGIHKSSDEDWRAFIHLWRVIGYLMGIEDRFNLCNGTVEETREKCNILFGQVFRPHLEQKDQEFLKMARYMMEGLYTINILIKYETFMYYLHVLSLDDNNNGNIKSTCYKLNTEQKSNLKLLVNMMNMLRWNWFRIFENYTHLFVLWLVEFIPLIPIYQFGYIKAKVRILTSRKKN